MERSQEQRMTGDEIRNSKLAFRNKVTKAKRCSAMQVQEVVGNVNLDFVEECVALCADVNSIASDYLDLYDFMIQLDKQRVGDNKRLKNNYEKAKDSSRIALEYERLLKEYKELLEVNKSLREQNNELLEFKDKFSRTKKVDNDLIANVNDLSNQGLSTRAIAQKLGISNCTVSKILNNKYA